MKFETVQVYFLSEFSFCCHQNILLSWQREVTTSPLYSFAKTAIFPLPWRNVCALASEISILMKLNRSRIWLTALIGRRSSDILF